LEEVEDPSELAVYQLIDARAWVRINELYSFEYSSYKFDSDIGSCAISNTGIATVDLQLAAARATDDHFQFVDRRDGTIIWGLYDHSNREEWVGPGPGSASIACFFEDDDEDEETPDPDDDEDVIVCGLSWSGEASGTRFNDDGNVTRQKSFARIDVGCRYARAELADECSDNPCDDGNPCTWDVCKLTSSSDDRCSNTGFAAAQHPIDCALDDETLGMCVLADPEIPSGPANCEPHPCGPTPCDDGDPCTYDFCALEGSAGTCRSAPNNTCLDSDPQNENNTTTASSPAP
jgi:hypothetical protein